MGTKKKQGQSNYWLSAASELLLVRLYEFDSHTAPDVIAANLHHLERQDITIKTEADERGFYDFYILKKNDSDINVHASGRIVIHGGTGETILRGHVRMGLFASLLPLFYLLILQAQIITGIVAGLCFAFVFINHIVTWAHIYQDRRRMIALIGEIVALSETEHPFVEPAEADPITVEEFRHRHMN